MASVKAVYRWPDGGKLRVKVKAKALNVEALADMRIETKRLFADGLASLVAVDEQAAAPDA